MKFLIKIEESINRMLECLLAKLKASIPEFIFLYYDQLLHLPIKAKIKFQKAYLPKLRIWRLKSIGYFHHYAEIIHERLLAPFVYLRSEEFKKADKATVFLKPIRYLKSHPLKLLSGIGTLLIVVSASYIIMTNAEKIAWGTYALRFPASSEVPEEDVYIEFKNHKFEVKIGGTEPAGHGAPVAEAREYEIFLNMSIEANNTHDKEYLEKMKEMLEDNIEALELSVAQLPLAEDNKKHIEEAITKSLNADFFKTSHLNPIKTIKLKQILPSRPSYYRQAERMTSFSDINLQIFLEDNHRNRQVWIDFSILASNRNVILYLKDHETELKDQITINVEPVIPQLPVEEEGRQIIKDKMRNEINQFLEKNGIDGKILEVYIDYLLAT